MPARWVRPSADGSAQPDDPQALIALGVAYYQTGQRGMTTDIYLRLKALDPDLARVGGSE